MAITKVSRGLLNTGISDSSDATAITIDSSERVGIGITSPSDNIHILGNNSTPNAGITIQTDDTASAQAGITLMSRNSANTNVTATLKNVTTALQSSLGITFGSDTAAANALDDYEEGYWTPSLPEGGTISTYAATYTKIGRQVIAYFYIVVTPTNNSQQFKIGGLPYTCINQSGYYPSGSLGYSSNLDLSALYPPLVMVNDTYAYFHFNNGNANFVTNSTMQKSGGLPIIGQVIYDAA